MQWKDLTKNAFEKLERKDLKQFLHIISPLDLSKCTLSYGRFVVFFNAAKPQICFPLAGPIITAQYLPKVTNGLNPWLVYEMVFHLYYKCIMKYTDIIAETRLTRCQKWIINRDILSENPSYEISKVKTEMCKSLERRC